MRDENLSPFVFIDLIGELSCRFWMKSKKEMSIQTE